MGANFSRANLQGADFRYSQLVATRLHEANLQYCKLQNADLTGARLRHADLREAVIVDAILTGSKWEETLVDGMVMDMVQFDYLQNQPVDLSRVHVVGTSSSRSLVSSFNQV
ncbi:pentapeptide repeat-containing protein [Paraflavitalea speifideaquila]|uniref:pentapeptide repeat-containing protein n=1 Tax=Paraflavitalea speifideaquila TaxID=3076558 RepID=UPI00331307CE